MNISHETHLARDYSTAAGIVRLGVVGAHPVLDNGEPMVRDAEGNLYTIEEAIDAFPVPDAAEIAERAAEMRAKRMAERELVEGCPSESGIRVVKVPRSRHKRLGE